MFRGKTFCRAGAILPWCICDVIGWNWLPIMWLARLLKISRENKGCIGRLGRLLIDDEKIQRHWSSSWERFCHWDKVRIGRARVLNETTAGSWSLLHRKRLFLACGIRSWRQSYYYHATTRAWPCLCWHHYFECVCYSLLNFCVYCQNSEVVKNASDSVSERIG